MKTRFLLMSMALASVMVSCSDKLAEQFQWDEGVMAVLPDYEDEAGTRVAFNNALTSFTWSNGDCIGVCRSSASANATAAFTLLKGGERVGNFINDSFSLLAQTDYYAFYPFATGATASSFPMNMVTQTQNGNNSVSHIGSYNYMSAQFKTDDNGKASFTFSNIGTIIQVHFTADKEDTYKNLYITSNGTPFIVRASYNLATETITSTQTNETFRVSFGEEGMHVYNGESVTISAIILPCDMSQSTLTFSVRNASGVAKEFSLAGFAFSKGKLYHFYEDDSRGNPPYGGCPDGNHPHMIDLGLPSGTLWSCCDLSANEPTVLGFEYVWGQTSFIQKNTSNWGNYEFMTDSYTNEDGISKYQVADGRTTGVWYSKDENPVFIGDNLTTLLPQHDAAHVIWGGSWRMPTKAETDELINYTYKVGTTDYCGRGKNGYVFYKKKVNGKYSYWDTHIFVPLVVSLNDSDYISRTESYWTSTLSDNTTQAHDFMLREGRSHRGWGNYDYFGRRMKRTDLNRIRPVASKSSSGGGAGGGGGTSW